MDTSSLINQYWRELSQLVFQLDNTKIIKLFELIRDKYEAQETVFVCANGGSVGAVYNLVTDLNLHPFVSSDKTKNASDRNSFKMVNLCSDTATITGIMNDKGPQFVYCDQMRYQRTNSSKPRTDALIAMSGSGNSPNILEALSFAKQQGMDTVLITRNSSAKGNQFSDLVIPIVGTNTSGEPLLSNFPGNKGSNNNNFYFEDLLFTITHMVCGLMKRYVGND